MEKRDSGIRGTGRKLMQRWRPRVRKVWGRAGRIGIEGDGEVRGTSWVNERMTKI